jgi:hypothetical protein
VSTRTALVVSMRFRRMCDRFSAVFPWPASCDLANEMECLISVVQPSGPRIIRVAGRLTEAHVPDLLPLCAATGGPVRIDLAELVSADGVGLETLRRLRTAGAAIVNAPRFIQLTLDTLPSDRRD